MTGEARGSKFDGVHPDLVVAVSKLLVTMAGAGFPMLVTDGLRTTAQQQALFAQGRTTPGKIVTYADGVQHRSNHQAFPDGFGHAVDCCFLVRGVPSWDERLPWTLYGATAIALGLKWGGLWQKPDKPHIELS